MKPTENHLTLKEIIHKAFYAEVPPNPYSIEQRKREEEKLLEGIEKKNSKAVKGSMGTIDLNMKLSDLLANQDSFLADIGYFIAGSRNGKYQYAVRFGTLLRYLNHLYQASFDIEKFKKKYELKDEDIRRLQLLMMMHPELNSDKITMEKVAKEFDVDIKTIREDFNRLKENFSFMGTQIKIKGFHQKDNSPVHPVFLALNTTQAYSLLYALKILSEGTVLEENSSELADTIYSQLSGFGQDCVADIYQQGDLAPDFQKKHIASDIFLRNKDKQVVLHAAAYKKTCRIDYLDGVVERSVIGIPRILREKDHNTYSVALESGDTVEIAADRILRAFP